MKNYFTIFVKTILIKLFVIGTNYSKVFAEQVIYYQDFSNGKPTNGWEYYSSTSNGRILVTGSQLCMDDDDSSSDLNLNEAILILNLASYYNISLEFFQAAFNDEISSLPERFTGHYNGDGVSISSDGKMWYPIVNASELQENLVNGKIFYIDLDQMIKDIQSSYDLSFGYTSEFKIKFQQYGSRAFDSDGRKWDSIRLSGKLTGKSFLNNFPDSNKWIIGDILTISLDRAPNGIYYLNDNFSDTTLNKLNSIFTMESNVSIFTPNHGTYYFHIANADNNYEPEKTFHLPYNIYESFPTISSISHPNQEIWYASKNVLIQINDGKPGINYRYIVDKQADSIPDASSELYSSGSFVLNDQSPGTNYIHVRAEDYRGSIAPIGLVSHFQFNILQADQPKPDPLPVVKNITITPSQVPQNGKITIKATISIE